MTRSRLPPPEAAVLSMLAHAFLRNARPAQAGTLLEALDLLAPGNPRTLRALALAQLRAGKADTALRTLDRLAMAGAADAVYQLLRAQVLGALGRPVESSAAMRSFIDLRARAEEH